MPDLNKLGFTPDEEIPADDINTIPEVTGSYELLQPRKYTFQLPDSSKGFNDSDAVEKGFFSKLVIDNKDYLQLNFRGKDKEGNPSGAPLRVKIEGGTVYFTQLNNKAAPYEPQVNDLLRLLKVLGHKETPKTNGDYANALLKYAGCFFGAQQVLTAGATKDKNGFAVSFASYVDPGETYTAKSTGKITIGLPKGEDGKYTEDIEYPNPNTGEMVILRVFGNLRNFYSVKNGG